MPIVTSESKSRVMLDNSRRCANGALVLGVLLALPSCDPNLARPIPDTQPVERRREPVVAVEGEASRSLLQAYIERDAEFAGTEDTRDVNGEPTTVKVRWSEEAQTWKLPQQAKRVVVALVIAAAHDRPENLRFILTPDATWGWPDPRRPGAHPVFDGDDGAAFFSAFRAAASRLPGKVRWKSFPVPPGIQMLHATGAEPMWTYYAEGSDGIMMHLVSYKGAARIDYIGLFDELPSAPPNADAYGPPPPMYPPRKPPPPGAPGIVPPSSRPPAARPPAAHTPDAGTRVARPPAANTPAAGSPAAKPPARGAPAAKPPAADTPAAKPPAAETPAAKPPTADPPSH